MMGWVIGMMIAFSVMAAVMGGHMAELTSASMSGCVQALELAITIAGAMALWSGLMKIAEQSGLTKAVCRLLLPLTHGVLFPSLRADSPALEKITMNMTANLMGLGNAATPLGIAAMQALEADAGHPQTATREMITFVAINTASMQLIPTTTAFLRMDAGSAHPMEILLPVWITSLASVVVAVCIAKLGCTRRERKARSVSA